MNEVDYDASKENLNTNRSKKAKKSTTLDKDDSSI